MSTVASLWPPEIFKETIRTPITVFKEQAAAIGKQTQNLIEGDVTARQNPNSGDVDLNFYLVVPTMSNFTFKLFEAIHPINLYPVVMRSSVLPKGAREMSAKDENELLDILRKIFSAEETKRVVVALLSQAKS